MLIGGWLQPLVVQGSSKPRRCITATPLDDPVHRLIRDMVDSAIVGLSCLFAVSLIWNIAMVYLMCRLDPELPNGLSRTLYAIVCGDASNRPSDKYAMRKTIDDEGDEGAAGRGQGQESKEAPPRQQSVRKHKRKATLLTVDDVLSTNQQWEIDPNKLRMKSIIGKGNFG